MSNKQLFRQNPDLDFVTKLINCFNIRDIYDTRQFCKFELQNYKTVDKIKELIPEMSWAKDLINDDMSIRSWCSQGFAEEFYKVNFELLDGKFVNPTWQMLTIDEKIMYFKDK